MSNENINMNLYILV